MADKPDHDAANAWRTAASTRPSTEAICAEYMHKHMRSQSRRMHHQTLEANTDMKLLRGSLGQHREPVDGVRVTRAGPRPLAS